jgi:hypothetical protein
VGEGEPGGVLVVEVGEGAFLEFAGGVFVLGDEAGVADGAEAAAVWVVEVAATFRLCHFRGAWVMTHAWTL